MLASSAGDDTGVPIASLIGRLSSFDLRLHFTLYRTYQPFIELEAPRDGETSARDGRVAIAHVVYPDIFIPTRELLRSLGVDLDASGVMRVEQSLANLTRERLLGQVLQNAWDGSPSEPYLFGRDDLDQWDIDQVEHGLTYRASANGMSLMAWGLGLDDPSPLGYRDAPIPNTVGDIELPERPTAVKVSDLPKIEQREG